MTVMEFLGCGLLAFGPPVSLFYITIADDAVKIIILIASSFFWLLALLLSSLMWKLCSLIFSVDSTLVVSLCFSVIFQELLRLVVYKLLRKAEAGLDKVSETGTKLVENKHILAYVSGLGFGLMSGLFALINILADVIGPGTLGLRGGHGSGFFLSSSLLTLVFIFLHTGWGVIFFHGMDHKNWKEIGFVVVTHFGASLSTLFNASGYIFASIIPSIILLIITLICAFRVAGGKISREVFQYKTPENNQEIMSNQQEPQPHVIST